MKANEAPKKLYFFEGETILSARSKKIEDANIEYVRTDAFIEKVFKWLEENVEKHISADGEYTVYYEEMFEELKEYMKGE